MTAGDQVPLPKKAATILEPSIADLARVLAAPGAFERSRITHGDFMRRHRLSSYRYARDETCRGWIRTGLHLNENLSVTSAAASSASRRLR